MLSSTSRRQPSHLSFTTRALAASGLGLAALVISTLLPSTPGPTKPASNPILNDWMYSHGASRHVQYDTMTGEFLLVGEVAHGLDYYTGGGGFWYCSFGGHSASPLLSFLLREWTVESHDQPYFYPRGLGLPYTDQGQYSLIRLEPLASQETFVNKAGEGTDYPTNYIKIPKGKLEFFLYQDVDGSFNIGVMDAGIAQELAPGEAEGDGSANKDNGVRIDVAFRAHVPLPSEKLRWTQLLDSRSVPYDTEHPTGF